VKLRHSATVVLGGWCLTRAPLLLLRVSRNAQAITRTPPAPVQLGDC
jgi:hypothetical protein